MVAQDIRGRGQSEGHHSIIFRNGGWGKRRDGHDTLLWIASQDWCNGKVATIGGSAVGITQNMLAPDAPDVLLVQVTTDTRHYHQLSDQVFRFQPVTLQLEDVRAIHGTNERISVDNLGTMLRFYRQLIINADTQPL